MTVDLSRLATVILKKKIPKIQEKVTVLKDGSYQRAAKDALAACIQPT